MGNLQGKNLLGIGIWIVLSNSQQIQFLNGTYILLLEFLSLSPKQQINIGPNLTLHVIEFFLDFFLQLGSPTNKGLSTAWSK